MPATWEATVNLKSASRGATGSTEIKGVHRARFRVSQSNRMSQHGASRLPNRVVKTAVRVTVDIETEDFSEWMTHLQNETGTSEKLVLTYRGSASATKTITLEKADIVGGGDSDFPPTEESGRAPRYMLQFELLEKTPGDTIVNSITLV